MAYVALRKESVDRNARPTTRTPDQYVALRKESVDRNMPCLLSLLVVGSSLSARRAWIEISYGALDGASEIVALRKESVDRNRVFRSKLLIVYLSLSARRAWIEIKKKGRARRPGQSRSPQGERG